MTKAEHEVHKRQSILEFNQMIARAHKRGQTQAAIARHLGVSAERVRIRIAAAELRDYSRNSSPIERYFAEFPVEGMKKKNIRTLLGYVDQIAEAVQ